MKVVDLFVCSKKNCSNISQSNRFKFCEKSKVLRWFKTQHIKINEIVVDQCKIAANYPTQMYLAIIEIRTILIYHHSNNDCRMLTRNKQDPSCSSNC